MLARVFVCRGGEVEVGNSNDMGSIGVTAVEVGELGSLTLSIGIVVLVDY